MLMMQSYVKLLLWRNFSNSGGNNGSWTEFDSEDHHVH